jgi:hypothetical protein
MNDNHSDNYRESSYVRCIIAGFLSLLIALPAANSQVSNSGSDADATHRFHTVWQIGERDGSAQGMALYPGKYADFLKADFGWEDKFYLIGYSKPQTDWPYVLPGPVDGFGGTSGTAGVRSPILNVLFGIEDLPKNDLSQLVIDLVGYQAEKPAKLKITINGHPFEYNLQKDTLINFISGNLSDYKAAKAANLARTVSVATKGLLKPGGNQIQITSTEGSWIIFDQVRLEAERPISLVKPSQVFLRDVHAANYEIRVNAKNSSSGSQKAGLLAQPLLVDVQQLKGQPELSVTLDGKHIFQQKLDTGRFDLEVPMPAVKIKKTSTYAIYADGRLLTKGSVLRSPQHLITPGEYIDTKMGTAHSRWMIAPGPWMPFSMVKLSPDNQDAGWSSGYDPMYNSIGTFSHIHEWTLSGLGTFPTSGPLKLQVGPRKHPEKGYRSKYDQSSEVAAVDYYKVHLTDHNILAELTATTRCSFQRYTYPKQKGSRIMIDLKTPAEYSYNLKGVHFKKVSDYRIEGYSHQFAPRVWSRDADQDYTVHFVIEFDQPIKKFGTWNG